MPQTVKSGDTLGRIARANDTTVAELAKLNPDIKDVNLIFPGQVIVLPDDAPPVADTDLPPPGTTVLPPPGTQVVGDATLPTGMRLIRVTNPTGSDAPAIFYAVSTVFGVEVAYEIGDRARVTELFGSTDSFGEVTTQTQTQFDNSEALTVGSVDEILGATGSLQAQFERDMRAAGLENPPAWMQADKKAMATFITAANERWSAERTWGTMSTLDSFKDRFAGLDLVMQQLGSTSFIDGITEYTGREAEIRSFLIGTRGPGTDTSPDYVKNLVGSGWQPAEVGELLSLEKRVKANPGALDNINQILDFQGQQTLAPDDFVSFLRDQDLVATGGVPSDMFEGINDALRFQALLTEGLEVDLDFATALGTGTSDAIASEESFSRQAQLAAGFIAANSAELDFDKLGLSREDIISATFGEANEGGKTVSEVNSILEQFSRERSKAAQGFAGSQSFIGSDGRLQTQGFQSFS